MPLQIVERNKIIDDVYGLVLSKLSDLSLAASFDCGDSDLNEYFQKDVLSHKEQLLTETYCLSLKSTPEGICALLDLCNDSIRIEKFKLSEPKDIPERMRHYNLPAVKITRLGVIDSMRRNGLGTHIINMVKTLFKIDNRTGCRLITVDAYNNSKTLAFYEKNGFAFFSDKDEGRQTRAMFFDLKRFIPTE